MNHLNLAHLISVCFCRKDFYPCQPDSEQTLKFQRKVKKKQKTKNSLLFLAEYWNKNLKNK